jgi:hypothetical protein
VGISTVIYPVADDDLRTFGSTPAALDAWLARPASKTTGISLQDSWRALADLLTVGGTQRSRPRNVLTEGDLAFPAAADRGAHGLWAASVVDLGLVLGTISSDHIEAEARRAWEEFAAATGRPQSLTPAQLRANSAELKVYLERLRAIADKAAGAGMGLLLARWEDW